MKVRSPIIRWRSYNSCDSLCNRKFKLHATRDFQKPRHFIRKYVSIEVKKLTEWSRRFYNYTFLQELMEDDPDCRREFCHLSVQCEPFKGWCCKIVFSDESTFYLNDQINKHNLFYYPTENERHFKEMPIKNCKYYCVGSSFIRWRHRVRHFGFHDDRRAILYHSPEHCLTLSLRNTLLSPRWSPITFQFIGEKLVEWKITWEMDWSERL